MLGRRLASEAQPGPGRRIERRLLSEAAFGVLFVVESRRKEKPTQEFRCGVTGHVGLTSGKKKKVKCLYTLQFIGM